MSTPNAQYFTVPCPRCVAEFEAGLRDEDQIGELAYQRVRLEAHERVGTSAKWGIECIGNGSRSDAAWAHSAGDCSRWHRLSPAEWLAADTAAQREVNGA